MFGFGFQQNYSFNMTQQFSWAAGLGQKMQSGAAFGVGSMGSIADTFGAWANMGAQSWSATKTVSYGAMPDFANAGRLDVDQKNGVVRTPGNYEIRVNEGKVQIKAPNGKFTDLKAEPPERVVQGKDKKVLPQLPRDPVVRESDGDVWRYQGAGTFELNDGTRITIQEQGKDKDLHISDVDIYNGNKHVHVDSKLESSKWKTHKTQYGAWKTTKAASRWQSGMAERSKTEFQHADQKFKTTFSGVQNDGFMHDAMNADGQVFKATGDGDDWMQNGREVQSGAGKGKDDKNKAFKLGGGVKNDWVGYRPLELPWQGYMTEMTSISKNMFAPAMNTMQPFMNQMMPFFGGAPAMGGIQTKVQNMGGFNSMYGGPMGGYAFYGQGFSTGFNPASAFESMLGSVKGLSSVFSASNMLNQHLMLHHSLLSSLV